MPITNKDRTEIRELIYSLGAQRAEAKYQELMAELSITRHSLELGLQPELEGKRFELAVEYLIEFETLSKGMSWWQRTKRRFELVKYGRNLGGSQ